MKHSILVVLFAIAGCVAPSTQQIPKRTIDPEKWVTRTFGSDSLKSSLGFYIEANPWSPGYERAIAITEATVLFVKVEYGRNGRYRLTGKSIAYPSSCVGLGDAVQDLRARLAAYDANPELPKSERESWFDGPTYTLKQYDTEGNVKREWPYYQLLGYGKIVSLGERVVSTAEKCL